MQKRKNAERLKKWWGVNFSNAPWPDDKTLELYKRRYKRFSIMRSEVLDEALKIENFLTVIILHFLVGRDYSRHSLLRAFIFEAEFCSFMQKRKMLSLIFEFYPNAFPFLKSGEAKKIRRELNDLILDRDMFAHGTIYVAGSEGKVVIEYYRGGKTQTELTKDTIPKILERCEYLNKYFTQINDFLRENRINADFGNDKIVDANQKP